MPILHAVTKIIDAVTGAIGKAASWLILLAIAVSATNAVVRKVFDMSSNAWLDLQWLLFSAVFVCCSAWVLRDDDHIRIDIVSLQLPKRVRDGIDVFGHLVFLLPFAVVIVLTSWPFFHDSFVRQEQSMNAGGLPVWPAKALIPLGFSLLALQGVSELLKRLAIMRGTMEDPRAPTEHKTASEAAVERHGLSGDDGQGEKR